MLFINAQSARTNLAMRENLQGGLTEMKTEFRLLGVGKRPDLSYSHVG